MILPWLTIAVLSIAQPSQPIPAELDPGVTVRVYHVEPDLTAIPKLVADQTPNSDELRPVIDLRTDADFGKVAPPFLTMASGWLLIPETAAGKYEFRLTSDDGSRLTLDGKKIIDHDGRHGATAKTSGPIDLTAGMHKFLLEHFDHAGKKQLTLEWKPAGKNDFALIPTENLRAERDLTRVTSPGNKQIDDGKRPGDGKPVAGVHPGWTLSTIHPSNFEPMVGAMTFAADGRLIVGTFSPLQRDDRTLPDIDSKKPDKLWAVSNFQSGDPNKIKVDLAAEGFYEPLGLCAVGDALYASHRKQITRLLDKDHDGFYETHEVVAEGWEGWNYHQFCFGLVHNNGHLYATLSTAMAPPAWEGMGTNAAPNGPMRGGVLDVDLSSNTASVIAGGLRAPNGIGFGPEGSLFYLDNQGAWMPTSQLCEVIPGRFYGHHNRTNFVPKLAERFPLGGVASVYSDRPRTPAAVWLPHNECSNSPTQPQYIDSGIYKGQMFIGELTGGGIRRVNLEKINGAWQGAVFQFSQGFEVGVNRLIWGPDGALYAGGIGAQGDWNWRGTKFGLQRLAPNGKVAFEMLAINATEDGFYIEWTKPINSAWLENPANYTVKQWTYKPTAEYGGPKVDVETLTVQHATPTALGNRVRLIIPGLKPGHCVSIRADPKSIDGEQIWSTEAWYSLQQVPTLRPAPANIDGREVDPLLHGVGLGVLPPAGAVPLLSASADPFFHKGADKELPREGNRTPEELLKLTGGAGMGEVEITGTGDLVTSAQFGDCRLHVEWLSPPGGEGQKAGNSGVYIQDLYEIQILNTPAQVGDVITIKNDEAGSIYKFKAPDRNASKGPGQWQSYDIWFHAPRFTNGKRTSDARITMYWNGVLVHNDAALPGPTGARAAAGEHTVQPIQTGPLRLQDHETAAQGSVRFRNIWIAPLHDEHYQPGEWEAPWKEAEKIGDDTVPKGWVVRGGKAAFRYENGVVIGETRPNTANTFLASAREYENFELLVDFKTDPKLNSGVQIRSELYGGYDLRRAYLKGPQVEIDPAERSYTGGLYDEARRGWLDRLIDAPYARRAFRQNETNRLRILATGSIIQTWINGVPATCAMDDMDKYGRIGFQVHAVGADAQPLEVRFWNLRIRELTKVEKPRPSDAH